MADRCRVLVAFGTRPEAIKMAPVIRELQARADRFETVVAVTGQHRTMLDQVLAHFGIVPDHDLAIMTPRQSLTAIAVRGLAGLDGVLDASAPDLVLVHGDAATSLLGSLAAFHRRIAVGHVEAGLRTGRRHSPFPEEMYRRLADVLADIHFAPTCGARTNLLGEGVDPRSVHVTGNTAIDALLWTVRADHRFADPDLEAAAGGPARLVAVECHRRENWGEPLHRIFRAIAAIAEGRCDVRIVVSVHRNPEVIEAAGRWLAGRPGVILRDPLAYPEWANLLAHAHFAITDSGGLQEEAPALGVPVVLCREDTERPEALEAGTVRLVGSDPDAIQNLAATLLDCPEEHARMARAVNPYGDGRAASRILDGLEYFLGLRTQPPDEWRPDVPLP
ncbi:MAG TPA: UDP-N-acetylglucosamine 2-epimerase (non-hydrolyzing) [Bacillota bacterium]|nr:UDP-N-acetylglucosamine 2-epimerase (non-hydrolyzing) [Bacillota bacterium]